MADTRDEERGEEALLPECHAAGADRGMRPYLVLLAPDEAPTAGQTRAKLRDRAMARGRAVVERMHELVAAKGFAGELTTPEEIPVLPILGIQASERVAELLETLPEVKAVVSDTDDVRAL